LCSILLTYSAYYFLLKKSGNHQLIQQGRETQDSDSSRDNSRDYGHHSGVPPNVKVIILTMIFWIRSDNDKTYPTRTDA
ncbi:hypothetical protein OQO70_005033, partial [Citrobacter freundii]